MIYRGLLLSFALVACSATGSDDAVWPDAGISCRGSTVLFLNRAGGVYGAGATDAIGNTSELFDDGRFVDVPPFSGDDDVWSQIVSCVRAVTSAYDLAVVDVDPGGTDHFELVVTTVGPDLGMPYTYSSSPQMCEPAPRGLGFVFAGAHRNRATAVCMTTVRTLGHLLGLEHVTLCGDVMSEAPGCALDAADRRFLDVDAPCGLVGEAACACTGSRAQNAHQLLIARLGPCQP